MHIITENHTYLATILLVPTPEVDDDVGGNDPDDFLEDGTKSVTVSCSDENLVDAAKTITDNMEELLETLGYSDYSGTLVSLATTDNSAVVFLSEAEDVEDGVEGEAEDGVESD